MALFSLFYRVVLGSWKKCVSITSIITPAHSWSCARATWTQITCRNTSVSSTGAPCVHKTQLNHQKQQTWPSCLTHPRQSLPHDEKKTLKRQQCLTVSHRSDPVSPQQQKPAHMKLKSGFKTNCLRTRGMLSFPLWIQTEKTEIGFPQQWIKQRKADDICIHPFCTGKLHFSSLKKGNFSTL